MRLNGKPIPVKESLAEEMSRTIEYNVNGQFRERDTGDNHMLGVYTPPESDVCSKGLSLL